MGSLFFQRSPSGRRQAFPATLQRQAGGWRPPGLAVREARSRQRRTCRARGLEVGLKACLHSALYTLHSALGSSLRPGACHAVDGSSKFDQRRFQVPSSRPARLPFNPQSAFRNPHSFPTPTPQRRPLAFGSRLNMTARGLLSAVQSKIANRQSKMPSLRPFVPLSLVVIPLTCTASKLWRLVRNNSYATRALTWRMWVWRSRTFFSRAAL